MPVGSFISVTLVAELKLSGGSFMTMTLVAEPKVPGGSFMTVTLVTELMRALPEMLMAE